MATMHGRRPAARAVRLSGVVGRAQPATPIRATARPASETALTDGEEEAEELRGLLDDFEKGTHLPDGR